MGPELAPGVVVESYRLDRTIVSDTGRRVFAATDLRDDSAVALTVIEAPVEARAGCLARLEQAATLPEHPNLAGPLSWGETDGGVFYAARLVAGVGLDELLRRVSTPGGLGVTDVLAVLGDVAAGVDEAHRHGIVHGGLSSASVVVELTRPRHAVVVDFGVATPSPGKPARSDQSPPATADDVAAFGRLADELLAIVCAHVVHSGGGAGADPETPSGSVHALLAPMTDPVGAASCGAIMTQLVAALAPAPNRPDEPARQRSARRRSQPAVESTRRRRLRWRAVAAGLASMVLIATIVAVATVRRVNVDSGSAVPATTRPPRSTSVPTVAAPPPTTLPSVTSASVVPSSTAAAVTAPATTMPVGRSYGYPVGAEVSAVTGLEAAFAVAVQQRANPNQAAVAGSPARLYVQWLHLAAPAATGPVTATADGFSVMADRAVTLSGFVVVDGVVANFTECVADACTPMDTAMLVADPSCQPGPGCPHLRSRSGDVIAYQRATLTNRWPAQVLLYELVVDDDAGRAVAAVDEPGGRVRYDPATGYMVATFTDRPVAGTRDDLTITFDDGSSDLITIIYG